MIRYFYLGFNSEVKTHVFVYFTMSWPLAENWGQLLKSVFDRIFPLNITFLCQNIYYIKITEHKNLENGMNIAI